MQKPVDVGAVYIDNRHLAQERLYVPFDPAAISGDRLFCHFALRQQPAGLDIGQVQIAQLGEGLRLARLAFPRRDRGPRRPRRGYGALPTAPNRESTAHRRKFKSSHSDH
jgi:hypothetical protein